MLRSGGWRTGAGRTSSTRGTGSPGSPPGRPGGPRRSPAPRPTAGPPPRTPRAARTPCGPAARRSPSARRRCPRRRRTAPRAGRCRAAGRDSSSESSHSASGLLPRQREQRGRLVCRRSEEVAHARTLPARSAAGSHAGDGRRLARPLLRAPGAQDQPDQPGQDDGRGVVVDGRAEPRRAAHRPSSARCSSRDSTSGSVWASRRSTGCPPTSSARASRARSRGNPAARPARRASSASTSAAATSSLVRKWLYSVALATPAAAATCCMVAALEPVLGEGDRGAGQQAAAGTGQGGTGPGVPPGGRAGRRPQQRQLAEHHGGVPAGLLRRGAAGRGARR